MLAVFFLILFCASFVDAYCIKTFLPEHFKHGIILNANGYYCIHDWFKFDCTGKPDGSYPTGHCKREYVKCVGDKRYDLTCHEGFVFSLQTGCTYYLVIPLCAKARDIDSFYK